MVNSVVVPENAWIKFVDKYVCLLMCTSMISWAVKVFGQRVTPRAHVKQ